jgi:hypothetical protein
MNLGRYGKAIVAGIGVASIVLGDNDLSLNDAYDILLAAFTVLGVYSVENSPPEGVEHGTLRGEGSTRGRHLYPE